MVRDGLGLEGKEDGLGLEMGKGERWVRGRDTGIGWERYWLCS